MIILYNVFVVLGVRNCKEVEPESLSEDSREQIVWHLDSNFLALVSHGRFLKIKAPLL